MLDSLNHQTVGPYQLQLERIGPPRFFDQFNFGIYLVDAEGKRSDAPVFRGLYNAGRPSIHVVGWMDGEFVENTVLSQQPSAISHPLTTELAGQIAEKLGTLIPPGGILWLAYESYHGEGAIILETRKGLKANLPLLTTPIGFLLFRANCWLGLKNWHFPEGGREGPMKLQGNKALNAEHARQRARESIVELENFLKQSNASELEARAQDRARIVLETLKSVGIPNPKGASYG